MKLATHLIKVKGLYNASWTEEKLRKYVYRKIREIDDYYGAQIELLEINDSITEVWVFISALFETDYLEELVEKWLKRHIKEDGLKVTDFEIREILNFKDLFDESKPKYLIFL